MVLVLCVDRDDDIGRKIGIKGPIVGEKKNLEIATKLILTDPEDTDANALFAAIKLHKEMKGSKIATITGHVDVGITSDEEIAKQLSAVLKKTKEKRIVFVTDGVEDEYVLPIIQNKAEIISIKKVIVRQSENLEGMYYLIKNFIEDKKMARTVFGIPAIILLLLAIFGMDGWRIVLGGIGIYMIIKAFSIDDILAELYGDFINLLKRGHVSSLFYAISGVFLFIGVLFGYNKASLFFSKSIGKAFLLFFSEVLFPWFLGGIFLWLGRVILVINSKKSIKRYLTYLSLMFAITIIVKTALNMLLVPEKGYFSFILAMLVGFITVSVFVYAEKRL